MPDANNGPEPLPVIPVEDPGLFTAEPIAALPVTPRRKGRPVIAWIVIFLAIAYVLLPRFLPRGLKQEQEEEDSIGVITLKAQARYLIGVSEMFGKQAAFIKQAQDLNTGTVDQRLRAIVLTGEMSGPGQALKELNDLRRKLSEKEIKPTASQEAVMHNLGKLYRDYEHKKLDAPSVSDTERALLRKDIDWFGELALAPAGGPDVQAREAVLRPAHRTVIAYFAVFGLACMIGFAGLVGLVIFLIFLFRGKLNRGVHCGSFHGSVYAETFAFWLVLFLGFSFASHYIPEKYIPEGTSRFLALLGLECLTLSALCWPVLRGIPWRQVRWETGFHLGKKPALEPLIGLAGNAMSIPLLALGVLATLVLLLLQRHLHASVAPGDNFSPPDLPSHPIVKQLAQATRWEYFQYFILASVIAPLVEETMFRGVLYRHLREATCNLGYAGSVLLSALVVSFLFAVIHPQGFIGMPPLMALAFTFSLLREWRGTLIPGMVAHGVNNGVVLLVSIVALG